MENNIFLGLGSNKGDRIKFLLNAVEKIKSNTQCVLVNSSSVYETTPYGNIDQENFFNAVINISSGLSPDELFDFIKQIEVDSGRTGLNKKWGPREIDVDILFYNQLIYVKDNLIIPHSEILKRDFVLVPLIEIAPAFIHPVEEKQFSELSLAGIESHIVSKFDYKLI